MTSSVPVECRVAIVENEIASIECWSYEFLPLVGNRLFSEWAEEFLSNQSIDFFYDLLNEPLKKQVQESGTFQLLFKGKMRGWYCEATMEWDEDMDVTEVSTTKEPPPARAERMRW